MIGLTVAKTLATIQRMAAIHTEFWMDPGLEQHNRLPRHGFWFTDPKAEIVDDFLAIYGVPLGPEVYRQYRAVLEQSQAIDQALHDSPWTLVHGDLRADNLMFGHTADHPYTVIIDWSWASRSMSPIDIAFLVGGSTPQSQRVGRHELNRGVRGYPLSQARRDLQLAALRAVTAGEAMHAFDLGPDTPIRAALFMDDAIQRPAAYALEIEAWEAMPDASRFQ